MRDPVRQAAFDLLTAVLDHRRPLDDALNSLPPATPRDRAAAHRLAATVLRRLGTLDAVLEPYLRKQPPEPVRHILRIGTAGLLLLDTPEHAAVATAVELARSRGLAPFAGLVNAVLRRIATTGTVALTELDAARLDTPPWMWSSWGNNARAIAVAHMHPAPLDLTLRPDADPPPGAEILPTGSVRFPPGTAPESLEGFVHGAMWVQDAAAALPATLLAAQPGERVADLCAAPGGKTGQLAASGATVTAVERDASRMRRMEDNLRRWRLGATLVQADAATWQPDHVFDAVLLDAPCSATGTIRRHPDVPRLKRPQDVRALTQAQDRLLAAAPHLLRSGGRLIYSVCSLQPEEGPERVAAALACGHWRLEPFTPAELAALPEARTDEGFLRTHPGMWAERGGMDGFFAARLVRVTGSREALVHDGAHTTVGPARHGRDSAGARPARPVRT